MDPKIIAACGINCETCFSRQRKKNTCEGCNSKNLIRSNYLLQCSIRNCELLIETENGFCYECLKFPCARLKQIDKRYSTKYHTSLIGNLKQIQTIGLQQFLELEKSKWRCGNCGGTLCVHCEFCLKCGSQKNKVGKTVSEG
jgi:hypothetical protein